MIQTTGISPSRKIGNKLIDILINNKKKSKSKFKTLLSNLKWLDCVSKGMFKCLPMITSNTHALMQIYEINKIDI